MCRHVQSILFTVITGLQDNRQKPSAVEPVQLLKKFFRLFEYGFLNTSIMCNLLKFILQDV